MAVGSVEYVVIAFPGNNFKGEIIPALQELVDNGTVRILDLVLVKKDANGDVEAVEVSSLGGGSPFDALGFEVHGYLNEADIEDIADTLPLDTTAGLLVWENTWSARFAQAVLAADGILLANERIPASVVQDALDYEAANS
jgi:hypothetical protein